MELHKISKCEATSYVLLDNNMRLMRPVNSYLEYLKLKGRAESTLKAYGQDLKKFFEFLEHNGLSYKDVDAEVIQRYVEYLRTSHENALEIHVRSARTGSTINRMIGTVYGFYSYLAAIDGTPNPIPKMLSGAPPIMFKDMLYHTRRSMKPYKSLYKVKESTYHTHIFSNDEIQRMYDTLPTERDRLLFKFLLQSGARIGEALSLRIEDVPIPDPTDEVTVIRNVKSKGKRRNIYIPTELAIELDRYIMEVRSNFDTDHSYIFTTQHSFHNNKRISYRGIYEVFKRAGKKAGLDFKFHDTRHTFVTNLIESGMDVSVVRILAGHAHIATTQKYITLSSKFIAKSLSEYWDSVTPKQGGLTHDDNA